MTQQSGTEMELHYKGERLPKKAFVSSDNSDQELHTYFFGLASVAEAVAGAFSFAAAAFCMRNSSRSLRS